ncbi:MAG: hypothetical protein JXP34_21365 [Planctomycetes bacterium]|nr:hypothetical protein [Planctomycetota bacterium]
MRERIVGYLIAAAGLLGGGSLMAQPTVLLREGFDRAGAGLPAGWKVLRGSWRVESGALVADAMDGEAFVLAGDPSWEDYEVEATATFVQVKEPSRWLSLLFRAPADGAPPWSQFCVRQGTNARSGLEFAVRLSSGWSVRTASKGKAASPIGRPLRLRVAVAGERVVCSLGGAPVIDNAFCIDRAAGRVGFGASGCIVRFDEIAVRRLPKPDVPSVRGDPAKVDCVGHRGFSAIAPENTVAAIGKAIEAGADGVEFDIYRTRDGAVVLMHDATVDRTTTGKGKVADLTLADLRKLDAGSWKAAAYAGEPVPTLDEALARFKGTEAQAVIEIKAKGFPDLVVQAVRKAGMLGRATAISFLDEPLAQIRALEPKLPCALLVGEAPPGDAAAQADALAARARACGAGILDLHYGMLSPELVAALRGRGFPVWCWTVNERPIMEALIRRGVESITTDRPDLLVGLKKEARAKEGVKREGGR